MDKSAQDICEVREQIAELLKRVERLKIARRRQLANARSRRAER